MLLGLKVDSAIKPKLGKMWHKVTAFPNFLQANKARNSQSQGGSQPQVAAP